MPTITLDQIRADIEVKYGPLDIDLGQGRSARLVPVLRLPSGKRQELSALQSQTGGDDLAAAEAAMRDMVRVVAASDADAEALLEVVGDDMALLAEILAEYGRVGQPGEA